MMRLYTYFRSTAAYRVRIALHLKGVEYAALPVHLVRGEHKEAAFAARNPQTFVPVLDDGGTLVAQSLAIIEYLDARYAEPRLLPAEPVLRARVQALALLIACDTHPLNNLRVLQYLRNELGLDEAAVGRWVQHWIAESFRSFEASVRETSGGRYCVGDAVSLADVCLVPQMFNARRFDCDLAPYPTLVRIADGLASLPAFERAAPANQPDAE